MSMRESLTESLKWLGGFVQMIRGTYGASPQPSIGNLKRTVERGKSRPDLQMLADLERKKALGIQTNRFHQIR